MRTLALLLLACTAALADEARERADEVARRLASTDREELLAALHEAAEHPHAALVPALAKLLRDADYAVREPAIEALARQKDEEGRKAAAKALAARLGPLTGKEEVQPELLKVIVALHDLAQPVSVKPLLDGIPHDEEGKVVGARLLAVANVPHRDAIEALLKFGSGSGKRRGGDGRGGLAATALQYATASKERRRIEEWRRWWSENGKDFDFVAAAEKRAEQRREREEKRRK